MFCPYCGSKVKEEHNFCNNCGKKNEKTAPPSISDTDSPHPLSDTTQETVLGGLASSDMARPGSTGYGVYITTRRVIGVKKPDQFTKAISGAIAGAVIGKVLGFGAPWAVSNALGRCLSNDENIHILIELERNKDFEASRRDITLIQLKSPGLTSLGQLAVFCGGETTTNIMVVIRTHSVYESSRRCFKRIILKFCGLSEGLRART
ncbi:MAG: zinc ribbon domain-containing protein [Thermodesulfobacteriales bacterium]|nr:MAG: zinc ribbon domain-containing protein [Thermodesulfobacteriales bacterium]